MSDKLFDKLLDKALDEAGNRAVADDLLRRWLDIHDDPCHYDHHGYCQAHFLEDKGDCIVEVTRNYLKKDEE